MSEENDLSEKRKQYKRLNIRISHWRGKLIYFFWWVITIHGIFEGAFLGDAYFASV